MDVVAIRGTYGDCSVCVNVLMGGTDDVNIEEEDKLRQLLHGTSVSY